MNEIEQKRRESYERRKRFYETNKELSEIDPNLLTNINLKHLNYFSYINFACFLSWFFLFKKIRTKLGLISIFGFWLIAQYNIFKYYYVIYPPILLRNTKMMLENEKLQEACKS
jgi:hypothetical protein